MLLKEEADARPIKTTGYQQTADTLSRKPPKNKAMSAVARNKLKGGGNELKSASKHNPTHGVIGKTTLTMSRDYLEVRHSKTTSAHTLSSKPLKNKATPTVSRSKLKGGGSELKSASKHNSTHGVTGKTTPSMSRDYLIVGHSKTTSAHTLSRKPLKNIATPTVSRSKLKGGGSELKSSSKHNPTYGVTGKTTPAMSRDYLKVRYNKKTSAPRQFHVQDTKETTTVAVSRNSLRAEHRPTTQSVSQHADKGEVFPATEETAQAISHNIHKMGQENNKQAESLKLLVPKEPQMKDDLKSPGPWKVTTSPTTTVALSSTQHPLKKQSLAKNETSVVLNPSEKLAPSLQSTTTAHSRRPQPRLASSLIFYSKASSATFESSSTFVAGNVSYVGSQQPTDDLVSCKESEILGDVSPPVGQETALGPVPDMRTCIELSCDHVGGDVAYMRSSQCFVITCQSPALCQGNDLRLGNSDINTTVAFLRKRGQHHEG